MCSFVRLRPSGYALFHAAEVQKRAPTYCTYSSSADEATGTYCRSFPCTTFAPSTELLNMISTIHGRARRQHYRRGLLYDSYQREGQRHNRLVSKYALGVSRPIYPWTPELCRTVSPHFELELLIGARIRFSAVFSRVLPSYTYSTIL